MEEPRLELVKERECRHRTQILVQLAGLVAEAQLVRVVGITHYRQLPVEVPTPVKAPPLGNLACTLSSTPL